MMANTSNYQEFMMVSVKCSDEPRANEYYIGVPDQAMLSQFDLFNAIEEDEVPRIIDAIHIADASKEAFKNRFQFRAKAVG